MKKLILKYIGYIITGIILIYIVISIRNYFKPVEVIIPNNTQVDSLNNIIKQNNILLQRNNKIIDSLYNHKSQITNRYETTIQNYINPSIVSDDSISRYISKELHNWK